MPKSELILAIEQICDEKNIPYESVVDSIEAALAVAYRKEYGNKLLNCRVEFNPEDGSSRIFDVKTVVEDPTEEELAKLVEQEQQPEQRERRNDNRAPSSEQPEQSDKSATDETEEEHRFNPKTDIALIEAKKIKPDAELGDEIISELPVPSGYGRVAAQTAKQVIIQKLREAEREILYELYKDRVGDIVNATVQRMEGPMVYMDLGQATALMPRQHQCPNERYTIGNRYKVYLLSVEKTNRGPEIIASRTAPEMVSALFTMEVPELSSEAIKIRAVAREAGSRSKIAVESVTENIDPIGSCVGQRGSRVQTVMGELGGEKIDIIEYNDDSVKFIVNALAPAKVQSIQLDEAERSAKAFVAEDQLSLAIGKGGQNVRLAAKLTGWRIDIMKNETKDSNKEPQEESEEPAPESPESQPESKEKTPEAQTKTNE